jgi:hypothetical protein
MKPIVLTIAAGLLAINTAAVNADFVNFEDVPGIAPNSHQDFDVTGFYSGGFHFTPGPQNVLVNPTDPHGNITVANDTQPVALPPPAGFEPDHYTWIFPNNTSQVAYADFDIKMNLDTVPSLLQECVECFYEIPRSFSLFSVDVAGIALDWSDGTTYDEIYEPVVTVTGTYLGGGTISTTITQDGIVDGPGGAADFLNHTFGSDWTGLTEVLFSVSQANPDYFKGFLALDNIEYSVSYVPEPSTWLLFGIGLLGLLGLGRRRLS